MKMLRSSSVGVVVAVIMLATLAIAPAGAAGIINVRGQDVIGNKIVIDSVNAPQDGWILIRNDANGAPGHVVGFTPVHQGLNQNVGVTLRMVNSRDKDPVTPTLWAMFVADPNATAPFAAPDNAINQGGGQGLVAFASSSVAAVAVPVTTGGVAKAPATTGGVAKAPAVLGTIAVKNQDVVGGQVYMDSVNTPQDGWILVASNAGGVPGAILGYAPVHQGLNQNVGVVIRQPRFSNAERVTTTLWAILVADPNANTPFASPNSSLLRGPWLASKTFNSMKD